MAFANCDSSQTRWGRPVSLTTALLSSLFGKCLFWSIFRDTCLYNRTHFGVVSPPLRYSLFFSLSDSSIHLVMFLFCIAAHFNHSLQQLLCPRALTSFPVLLISLMGISIKMGNWDLGVSGRINALHLKAGEGNRTVCSIFRSHLFLLFGFPSPFLNRLSFNIKNLHLFCHFLKLVNQQHPLFTYFSDG